MTKALNVRLTEALRNNDLTVALQTAAGGQVWRDVVNALPKQPSESAEAIVKALVRIKAWRSTSCLGISVDASQYTKILGRARAYLKAKKGRK